MIDYIKFTVKTVIDHFSRFFDATMPKQGHDATFVIFKKFQDFYTPFLVIGIYIGIHDALECYSNSLVRLG